MNELTNRGAHTNVSVRVESERKEWLQKQGPRICHGYWSTYLTKGRMGYITWSC